MAMSGISSSTVAGSVHISASGTRRSPADQRALVARCVAMKNIADQAQADDVERVEQQVRPQP